jgi:membrane associated rhomboid family serine protease
MFPIRDTLRSKTIPLFTWGFILINTLVFLFELGKTDAQLQVFINQYGLVPSSISLLQPLNFYRFLTHLFIHGGWVHYIGNMWFLFVFGDNVEGRMGSVRYLFFYLLGGTAAGLLEVWIIPTSSIPSIGASGAIAAVLGAYLIYFPKSRILTLIPIFIIPFFTEISSNLFIGFWFLLQLCSGLGELNSYASSGVAWWTHIGGFIFGLTMAGFFVYGLRRPQWMEEE